MIEVSELRDYLGGLGVGSDADDKVLRELEKAAVAMLENKTFRTFEAAPASTARIIDGSGQHVQRLPDKPDTGNTITVETRSADTWSTIAAADYLVIDEEKRPRLVSYDAVWPKGRDNVRITATVGYATKGEPAEVRQAVKSLVAHQFVSRAVVRPTEAAAAASSLTIPEDVQAFIDDWGYYQPYERTILQGPLVRA